MVDVTDEALKSRLQAIFGPHVSFDRVERKLYSHDVGSIPRLIKPFTAFGLAGAVVRPGSEEQLSELIALANASGFELVPRGASTAGYGGSVPHEGAVVVDMKRLRGLHEVDRASMTVVVGAGAVWRDVEAQLAKEGLALAMYPSSAPSSTVGGWLAQGGTGFGSHEHGWFKDLVRSVRVVRPDGTVRELRGSELDLVADAEGITGFITRVAFSVVPLQEVEVAAVRAPNAGQLQAFLDSLRDSQLPLWSVSFLNPAALSLAKQMPPKLHHGLPMAGPGIGHVTNLGEGAYLVLLAWHPSSGGIADSIAQLASEAGCDLLPETIARQEWDLRYSSLRLKRIGPSVIPTEVIVPVENLAASLTEIDDKVKLPLVIEGMGVKGKEYVLLGFIPHDERSFGFNAAFGLSLSVIRIAREHGGRAYSTGVYFKRHAEEVLGADKLRRLKEEKQRVDRNGIMNPDKVFGDGRLTTLVGLAESGEPAIRAVGNVFGRELGEKLEGGAHGIPDDVARYAYACAQCGYCVEPCEQFSSRGWESQSPRGKFFYLREVIEGREKFSQEMTDKFLLCTTCEFCEHTCPLDLPVEPSWMKLRGQLIDRDKKMTIAPFEMMAASLEKEGNIWAAFRDRRADWLPEHIRERMPEKAEIAYFAGCTASYVEPDIAQGSVELLDAAGVQFTYLGEEENCCGIPMLMSGKWDVWEANMRRNVANMKAKGVKTVVTSCPACHMVWKTYYPEWCKKLGIDFDFEAKHYSEVVEEQIKAGKVEFPAEVPMKVTFHDSCHLGRASGVYEPPRELLKAIPGLELREMEHNRKEGLCCGSVLTLIGEPPVAHEIGDVRIREALAVGVKDIVALCPCCQFQLRVSADRCNPDVKIHDLSHMVAKALGKDLVDPTPYALTMWAVFEKMVYLMKPEAMAKLMEELYPQMLDAMPLRMGKMMRFMGRRVPFMLGAMKPVMPKLFPILMPGIMEKVMPDMLEAVGSRIPMPEHMRRQMPDLLPKTMKNLMPNMLPMLMPYVVPSLIAYLKGERPSVPERHDDEGARKPQDDLEKAA